MYILCTLDESNDFENAQPGPSTGEPRETCRKDDSSRTGTTLQGSTTERKTTHPDAAVSLVVGHADVPRDPHPSSSSSDPDGTITE
jgi:hypothetical protein